MSNINNEDSVIVCNNITIRDVTALKDVLLARFRAVDELVLDVRDDAAADLAGVQLICSAHRYALEHGKHFALARPAVGPLAAVLEQGGFLAAAGAGRTIWSGGAGT